jgi:hypothetical protein
MAWSVLQSASFTETTAALTSFGVTYGTNLSAGTKLIAVVEASGGGSVSISTTQVKDGAGNSFTKIYAIGLDGNTIQGELSLWAMDTPAGDVGTKPTITATTSSGEFGANILVQEVSGLAVGNTTAAMIDGSAQSVDGPSGATTGSPSYSSTAVNEYLMALYGDNCSSTITWTAPGGYNVDTHAVNSNSSGDCGVAYKNSTGGTETGSWSRTNTSSNWAAVLVAFQLAPSAATVWPDPSTQIPPGLGNPMAWQNQEPTWLTPEPIPAAQTPVDTGYPRPPGFMSPMAWQDQTAQYNPQIPPAFINFTDSVAVVDAESAPAVAVSLADPVAVADLASGLTFPPFTDAAGVVESIQVTVPITLADAVAVVDAVSVAVAVTFTDAAGVTDLASARTFPYPEAAGVTDAFAISIGITLADVAAITDLPLPVPVISAVPAPPWTPPAVTPGRVLWGTGILLTAPSGTAVPSDQNLGVASAWLALGWTYVGATVDGVQISYAPTVTELSSAEGTPLAEVVTAADVTISVALSEETLATIALATGNNAGVAVTAAGPGQPGKQKLSLSTTWPTMAAALIGLNQLGYARVLLVPSVVSTGQMAAAYRRAASQRAYPVVLTATCPWTSITWTDLTSVATS